MNVVQILYGDKMMDGRIAFVKTDYMELEVDETDCFEVGEYFMMFNRNSKFEMRILDIQENKICIFPSNSDIFLLGEQKIPLDPNKLYQRFRFETIAVLHQLPVLQKVVINTLDVSRHGVFLYVPQSSLEVNNGPLIINQQYQSVLFCNEQRILPTFIIRRQFPGELGIRYLAEFYAVSKEDVRVLRNFIVTEYIRSI
jgi:hypothetical protein